MSRSKVVWMLFLSTLVGVAVSVFLFQASLQSYKEHVVAPSLSGELNAVQHATELFARRQVSQHPGTQSLQGAYEEAELAKRKELLKEAIAGLKKNGLAKADLLLTLDKAGKMLTVSDSDIAAAELSTWSQWAEVQAGKSVSGYARLGEKAYFVSVVPVMAKDVPLKEAAKPETSSASEKKDSAKKDKGDAAAEPNAKKCSAGREWRCVEKCLRKRGGKCVKKGRKKCACFRIRKKPKARASATKTSAPTGPTSDAKVFVGALVSGFALNNENLKALQQGMGADVAFFGGEKTPIFGSTLSGVVLQQLKTQVRAKAASIVDGDGKRVLEMELNGQPYAIVSMKMDGLKGGLVVLKPTNSMNDILRQQILFAGGVGLGTFLLALLLLLPGVTRMNRDVEEVEEHVLEMLHSGKLDANFNESASGTVGGLSKTLNKFCHRLLDEQNRAKEVLMAPVPSEIPGVGAEVTSMPASNHELSSVGSIPAFDQDSVVASSSLVTVKDVSNDADQAPPPGPLPSEVKDEPTGSGALPSFDEILLQEPDEHYRDVYHRYVQSKKELGQDISRLKEDRFIKRLRKNVKDYMAKYDCRGVIFDLSVKGNKVILKPQLIPKEL